jgi:hypothetical protein
MIDYNELIIIFNKYKYNIIFNFLKLDYLTNVIIIFNYFNYNISFLDKWKIAMCFMAIDFFNYHVVKS